MKHIDNNYVKIRKLVRIPTIELIIDYVIDPVWDFTLDSVHNPVINHTLRYVWDPIEKHIKNDLHPVGYSVWNSIWYSLETNIRVGYEKD